MTPSLYPWLALGGIVLSAAAWCWLLRRDPGSRDPRLALVYLAGLAGAFAGAKLLYTAAEGWLPTEADAAETTTFWQRALVGKSILGALLGGYGAVELAKRLMRYPRVTGDIFAIAAPLGIIIGRAGCLLHGCCLGRACAPAWYAIADARGTPRWPAVPVEMAFNATFLGFALAARRAGRLEGQLFHVYLIAYGAFRFAHELARDTPRVLGPLSGYQLAALAVMALGVLRLCQRAAATAGA